MNEKMYIISAIMYLLIIAFIIAIVVAIVRIVTRKRKSSSSVSTGMATATNDKVPINLKTPTSAIVFIVMGFVLILITLSSADWIFLVASVLSFGFAMVIIYLSDIFFELRQINIRNYKIDNKPSNHKTED